MFSLLVALTFLATWLQVDVESTELFVTSERGDGELLTGVGAGGAGGSKAGEGEDLAVVSFVVVASFGEEVSCGLESERGETGGGVWGLYTK